MNEFVNAGHQLPDRGFADRCRFCGCRYYAWGTDWIYPMCTVAAERFWHEHKAPLQNPRREATTCQGK